MPNPSKRLLLFLAISFLLVLAWSANNPYDRVTWWMEVLPALAGFVLLAATYKRFPFTPVTYVVVWAFSLILLVGGHYTYALVPFGNWLRDTFHFSRNHFDRIGHFMQGVTPAMVGRELLVRLRVVRRGGWLFFLVCAVALAISASYELVEWIAAAISDEAAEQFVGMQGDVWDAQKDMALALVGSIVAQLLFARLQDRQIGID